MHREKNQNFENIRTNLSKKWNFLKNFREIFKKAEYCENCVGKFFTKIENFNKYIDKFLQNLKKSTSNLKNEKKNVHAIF